ncbi:MAG: PASTA domain-containing protein [Candidatus Marinimicrobia bacterium]|nr:PASTA domain-containing protein [Candidatus Neomarinimicrobiota bacterium]MCF7904584.1 PASTA domain-containing protein [Candidatus Neomarinimicrobiota bacterium]
MKFVRDYIIIFSVLGLLFALLANNVILPIYVNWNDEIRVPSLTHTDLDQADKILKERKLEWVVKDTVFRSDIPEGFIMDQHPEPGQMVKENRKIQLTISLPPEKLEMPDLVAVTERQATIAVEQLGLILVDVQADSSDLYEKTVVMDQSIAAGLPVAPGDSITLTVSLGKRNLKKTMPNLLNKGLDEAVRIMQRKGFRAGNISYTQDPALLPNTVVSQSIDPGKMFPKDQLVSVDLIIIDGF